jgi:hypothetical protein
VIVSRGNGRYDVMSESGKRLGKNLSKGKAEKRLAQVEYWKAKSAKRGINRRA